mmetsp:Transcript_5974/g.11288  ORF Transcript_5974/g.11288 Transcript_5974/m.11288 type:complete len:338 (+) Transcript_5974:3810-4823(+)
MPSRKYQRSATRWNGPTRDLVAYANTLGRNQAENIHMKCLRLWLPFAETSTEPCRTLRSNKKPKLEPVARSSKGSRRRATRRPTVQTQATRGQVLNTVVIRLRTRVYWKRPSFKILQVWRQFLTKYRRSRVKARTFCARQQYPLGHQEDRKITASLPLATSAHPRHTMPIQDQCRTSHRHSKIPRVGPECQETLSIKQATPLSRRSHGRSRRRSSSNSNSNKLGRRPQLTYAEHPQERTLLPTIHLLRHQGTLPRGPRLRSEITRCETRCANVASVGKPPARERLHQLLPTAGLTRQLHQQRRPRKPVMVAWNGLFLEISKKLLPNHVLIFSTTRSL